MGRIVDAYKPKALEQAAGALDRGQLVVVPTDTVYGIAARVDRPEGLNAIFDAKGRPPDLALPVLVGGVEEAQTLGRLDDRALRLAESFWPGPLTIVVPRAPGFTAELGGDGDTVGLRVPDHPIAAKILERTGPLAVSSANLSGDATPRTPDAVAKVFGDAVAVYLDAGPAPGGPPSTVVSISGRELKILREGQVSERKIRDCLKS